MKPGIGSIDQTIRILLVDDQAIVREGLRMLLENQPGMAVIAEAADGIGAIKAAQTEHPDVILLDLDLGEKAGQDCLTELLRCSPQTRILVLTGVPDLEEHQKAIRKGAMGLVRKLEAPDTLLKAIRRVYEGEVWLDGMLMARLLTELWDSKKTGPAGNESTESGDPEQNGQEVVDALRYKPQPPPPEDAIKIAQLTDREREVISLVGEGLRNQQIADRLFISVITVRHHISSIFSKLEVQDRFELAIYAYRYGLAKLPF